MKKMSIAMLCGMFLVAGACFAADSSEKVYLYPIQVGEKWGYIDRMGKMII